jgi:UDP-glucose:(heptosyl)LPS alpha-1,3-glucosyltransferase
MKIALVILHADPSRGGAERYTIDLAAALVARGHDVSLIAASFAGETAGRRVPLPMKAATRLGRYLMFLDALDAHLAEESYDIVHAMLPVRRCDVYHPHAGLAAEAIVSAHEKYDGIQKRLAGIANRLNPKRLRFASVERRLLDAPNPPVVLCLSEYVKATVRTHYSLPDQNLATLFNAVDLKKFDPSARPDAGNIIRRQFNIRPEQVVALIIAQDFRRKGLTVAIGMLPRDDARLVLLVVGKEKTTLYEHIAKAAGIEDRVIFAGPTNDPYAFYKAADLFVLPTRHDPCSLVVLEALAMGVPVISTVFNGACEIMTDGTHGFVLGGPRPAVVLLERYRQMLNDAERQKMRDACLALRPRLSQKQHVDQLIAIYENAISRSLKSRPSGTALNE